MELNFEKQELRCLGTAVQEVRNCELTQEIRLPDGMPDVGRVVSAWGQVILRGKEWRSDSISLSGGMMVWVLYAPEDGTPERSIDAWIPFQMEWDLSEGTPEGTVRVLVLPRFVDGRSTSARKIMVRSGVAAMAEAYVPETVEVFIPGEVPEGVQILQSTYPVRLPVEAGEKTFLLDEDLVLPDSAPQPEKILSYRLNPKISDRKVLSNKVVFRGNGNLRVLYRSEEGQVHSWDFDIPFSQYAALDGEHGTEALADFWLVPTGIELQLDDEGHLRLKGGMTAQYLITDKRMVELVEDAYSPEREVAVRREELRLPAVLENRRENIYGEQTLPGEVNLAADVNFLPDFPRQRRGENGVELEIPGTFQVLYYGEDGVLRSGTARWEGRQRLNADENSDIRAIPSVPENPQAILGSDSITLRGEIPLDLNTTTRQQIPMVSGMELGQQRQPDPDRPSLILRRAGDSRLWDIARENNSTIDAIRRANNLQSEPAPEQMLLIPVP